MLLIIEIAVGIVLGAFLLWIIHAADNYQTQRRSHPDQEPELRAWLVCIGGQTECMFDKEKGKGYCCGGMIYDPWFANTVHQFPTYDEARAWAKEMVNVDLGDLSWEAPDRTYWHGNLEVREVTHSQAAQWMEHRIANGKVDPVYLAECEARAKASQEQRAAEESAHMVRMLERRARGQIHTEKK